MVNMQFSMVFIIVLAAAAAEAAGAATISCEANYTLVATACYLVSPETHAGSAAEQYCAIMGGHAAIIESEKEMELLKATLLDTTVFLGVNMQSYRKYQFSVALKLDGHTGFTDFGAGEPNNYGSGDCIVADISDGFKWKDIQCIERHNVLCKAEAIVGKNESSCGEDETEFENSCYWVEIINRNYNFTEALDECRGRGLELASIHSQQEQDLVTGLAGGHQVYIGLTDVAVEGEFRWTEGTPLDFESWYSSNPDGGDSNDCVYIYSSDGEWSDCDCVRTSGLACKGAPRPV